MRTKNTLLATIAGTTLALALTGCTAADSGGGITVTDPWVKAVDDGMTAAFGTVHNDTADAVVVVSATTNASPMVELHETLMADDGSMMMSEKDGGFSIEPGGELLLEPGGNHIMLMGVADPIEPGDTVTITLTLADGTDVTFDAVAKDYAGANEEYDGGMEMSGEHDEHDG